MQSKSLLLVVPLAAALTACDPPGGTATEDDIVAPQFAAQQVQDWGPAVRLTGNDALNTTALEGCPSESPDGRSLFFASNRALDIDIWVTHRDDSGEWGEPEMLPKGVNSINSSANDYCPTALPDGGLLFVSERADGQNCGIGTADIYESRLHPERGWLQPRHLGCVINSPASEFAPSYVPVGGGRLYFSSNRAADSKHAIYVSRRGPGGVWQTPEAVPQLNAVGFNTLRPNVSQDGRLIVFDSDRPPSLGNDLWYSRRATPHAAWSAPMRFSSDGVDPINSDATEARASLSRDGKRLYFGSNRDATQNFDIFVTERH